MRVGREAVTRRALHGHLRAFRVLHITAWITGIVRRDVEEESEGVSDERALIPLNRKKEKNTASLAQKATSATVDPRTIPWYAG